MHPPGHAAQGRLVQIPRLQAWAQAAKAKWAEMVGAALRRLLAEYWADLPRTRSHSSGIASRW